MCMIVLAMFVGGVGIVFFFFFKQKTAYEMRISAGVQTCALPICQRRQPRLFRGDEAPCARQMAFQARDARRGARGKLEGDDRPLRDSERLRGKQTPPARVADRAARSEEHTYELQSLMRISYAVFCLKTKRKKQLHNTETNVPTLQH